MAQKKPAARSNPEPTQLEPSSEDSLTEPETSSSDSSERLRYHLIIVSPDCSPLVAIENYDTRYELTEALKHRIAEYDDLFLLPIIGEIASISQGPFFHLMTSNGVYPLFDVPATELLVPTPLGYIGGEYTPDDDAAAAEADDDTDDSVLEDYDDDGTDDSVLEDD